MSANLADFAAAGWKKYDALKKAARRTRDDPDAKELVSLTTHKIASAHHPSVELYLDGRSIATVEIGLEVALTIAGVIAVEGGPADGDPIRELHGQRIACRSRDRHNQEATQIRSVRRVPAGPRLAATRAGPKRRLCRAGRDSQSRSTVDTRGLVLRSAAAIRVPLVGRLTSDKYVATNGRTMSDPLLSEPDSDPATARQPCATESADRPKRSARRIA